MTAARSLYARGVKSLRCDHCGALAGPATTRCRYCGAVPVTTVLRARLVRDVLDVFVDSVPRGSFRCPIDLVGGVLLFVQVAKHGPSAVRFVDPSVKLPM